MEGSMEQISKFLKNNQINQYLTRKYFDYAIITLSLLLSFYLKWEMQSVIEFSFVIWLILKPIPSKLLSKIALCFLAFVPFFLIVHRADRAEQFAIFAYYFLVLTIIMVVIESTGHRKTSLKRRNYTN